MTGDAHENEYGDVLVRGAMLEDGTLGAEGNGSVPGWHHTGSSVDVEVPIPGSRSFPCAHNCDGPPGRIDVNH